MQIEVWVDLVCPWCYIGTGRLQQALAGLEDGEDVEVRYRSFQLDPSAPSDGQVSVAEHLGAAYGGGGAEAGRQMAARTEAIAAQEGITFDHADAPWTNSRDGHRLLHLALDEGGPDLQARLGRELFAAYFERARNLADPAVLREAAAAAGLDAARVEEVLAGQEYDDRVARDVEEAAALGATGVPFFVLDRRYAVSGAQPVEVFAEALELARTGQGS
ncbi:MAG: DsbA family oxidoreductase [Marmoricola sp.]|nr:DsbA family oxidoreductase [Marmoricola sp.]